VPTVSDERGATKEPDVDAMVPDLEDRDPNGSTTLKSAARPPVAARTVR
jgi:hypothetical protein